MVQSALNELVDLRKKLSAATTGSSSAAAAATGGNSAAAAACRQPETPLERAWDKVLAAAERDPDVWARQMENLFMSLDWEGNTLINVAELCGSLVPHGVAAFALDEKEAFRADINPRGHAGTLTCAEFAACLKQRGALEALAVDKQARRNSIKAKAVQRRKSKDAALALLKAEAAAEDAAEDAVLQAAATKASEAQAQADKAAEAESQTKLHQQEEQKQEEEQQQVKQQQKQEQERTQQKQEATDAAEGVAADGPPGVDFDAPPEATSAPKARRSVRAAPLAPAVEDYHASEEAPGWSLEVCS